MRAIRLAIAYVFVVMAMSGQVQAAPFLFDVTFDGVSATVDPSSDPVAGTVLNPGDTFQLDIHAAGNDFWSANADYPGFLGATFEVGPAAQRTANATATLFLDGIQVAQINEPGVFQSQVHIGMQYLPITSGLEFDQVVVDYQLLTSSVGGGTTIANATDVIAYFPFFRDARIDYVQGVNSVPEPTSLALLATGAFGFVGYGWRRKRKLSAC